MMMSTSDLVRNRVDLNYYMTTPLPMAYLLGWVGIS